MKRVAKVEETSCVSCGECMYRCPLGTITIPNGIRAVVDESKCRGCGICVKGCPTESISIKNIEDMRGM